MTAVSLRSYFARSQEYLTLFWLCLAWLMGAAPGPVPQLAAWGAAMMMLAGCLMVQSASEWPRSLVWAAGLSLVLASLQYAGLAVAFSTWLAQASPGEMLANLRQRNQFASLMVLGFLSAMALQAESGKTKEHAKTSAQRCAPMWARAQTGILFVRLFVFLLGFGSALSGSRTGLLQWLTALGLFCVWQRSLALLWAWLPIAGALGYALGVLAGPALADLAGHANIGLLGRVQDVNAFSRIELWSNVLELIAEQPMLGHGWRSLAYVHYAQDFSGTRFMEMPDNAHNLPLHLAVELGLPVAIGFCGFVAWLIWRNKPWKETQPERQLAWGVLLMIGIHSLLEYPLWYGPFFMTTVICVGVLCADLWRNLLLAAADTAQDAIILGVRAMGVALLVTTAFVAFDYHRVSQIYLQPEQRSSWYAADPLTAAKQSVLFQPQAKFAELQITPLSKETAPRVFALSSELVRWSPEPRIVEKLIESAVMMELDDVAAFHLKRYLIAYPAAYAQFMGTSRKPTSAL